MQIWTTQQLGSLAEQANSSLYELINKDNLKDRFAPIICDLLVCLGTYVPSTKISKMLDIIHEIVTSFEKEILQNPETLIDLLKVLVQRGVVEYETVKEDPKHRRNILNKIWNIIRSIGDTPDYVLFHAREN